MFAYWLADRPWYAVFFLVLSDAFRAVREHPVEKKRRKKKGDDMRGSKQVKW
jgi:hypothetical protein